MNRTGFLLLFLLLFFLPTEVAGRIYVCVDGKGVRQYSDKKCPINKKIKTEVIENLGKTVIPDSVLRFTPIIQIVKRTLSMVNEQIPDNVLYRRAYQYVQDAEKYHNNFLSKPNSKMVSNYNPFDPAKLSNIIAAISQGCRAKAYMTICGAIEGNYWLNGEEQIYLKERLDNGLHYIITKKNKKLFCEKTKLANLSGVVSYKIVDYFCNKLLVNPRK